MNSYSRTWVIGAGVALWLPLLFSFLGALRSPAHVVGLSQALMVGLLVLATLLLGMLIGRSACAEPSR